MVEVKIPEKKYVQGPPGFKGAGVPEQGGAPAINLGTEVSLDARPPGLYEFGQATVKAKLCQPIEATKNNGKRIVAATWEITESEHPALEPGKIIRTPVIENSYPQYFDRSVVNLAAAVYSSLAGHKISESEITSDNLSDLTSPDLVGIECILHSEVRRIKKKSDARYGQPALDAEGNQRFDVRFEGAY